MTNTRPAPLDPHYVRRAALELRAWICAFAAWVLGVIGEGWMDRDTRIWTRAELKRAERNARALIALLALMKVTPPPPASRTTRPRSFRAGFRRQLTRASFVRRACSWTPRGRGSIQARLRAFTALLDNMDAHVARIGAKIARASLTGRLVIVRPRASRCESAVPVPPATAGPVLQTGPPC